MQEDYLANEVFVIEWHSAGLLSNTDTVARANYYGGTGSPNVVFDGKNSVFGGGPIPTLYSQYKTNTDVRTATTANATVTPSLVVDVVNGTVEVTVDVVIATGASISNPQNVHVRAALVEDGVQQCCEPFTGHRVFDHIGRAMVFDVLLTASSSGSTQQVVQTYPLDPAWDPDRLWVAGFLQRDIGNRVVAAGRTPGSSSTGAPNVESLSTSLELTASPSPFRQGTTLRFTLPQSSRVTLDVHDVSGRRVASLADATYGAGEHALRWNARDAAGRAVAPGVYFVRLSAGDHRTTREIVRVR